MESTVFLVFLAAWSCFAVCGAFLTVRDDRLTLAMGMYAIALALGLSALFVALNLHQWIAGNGDQVAEVAKSVGKIMLGLTGMAAMAGAILSNAALRTRIALAAYSLSVLASMPFIAAL